MFYFYEGNKGAFLFGNTGASNYRFFFKAAHTFHEQDASPFTNAQHVSGPSMEVHVSFDVNNMIEVDRWNHIHCFNAPTQRTALPYRIYKLWDSNKYMYTLPNANEAWPECRLLGKIQESSQTIPFDATAV